jgi:hypothetical protein
MLVTRLVIAVFAAALPISPSVAHSAAGPATESPQITTAAWFQPDPLCSTPLGCGAIPLPALSPYPKGTYHVGAALGRQTARAFIGVSLTKRAQTARGGTLSIPLDTNPADGSVAPSTAAINVCVIYQSLTSVEGAFVGAPTPNCLPAAPAKYVAKPAPHLVADLAPLGGKLGGVRGFALLPASASPTSAWHVVFKLPTDAAPKSELPKLTLLIGNKAAAHPAKPQPSAHHHNGAGSSGEAVPAGPAPELPPAVTSTQPGNPDPVVAPTRTAGHYVTIGYQYPEIWLLPLVLIVLVPFTIRAMTRDLTRER